VLVTALTVACVVQLVYSCRRARRIGAGGEALRASGHRAHQRVSRLNDWCRVDDADLRFSGMSAGGAWTRVTVCGQTQT